MDPLSVLGAAESIITHANRIKGFIDASKTNTKRCDALCGRLERLREVAVKIEQHPEQASRLSADQVQNVKAVLESVEATVRKYYRMRRAVKVIFAVPLKQEFTELNEELDSVLLGIGSGVEEMAQTLQV